MVFNTCNKWKSNEKKGAFSAVIVSSGIKMENVQYNKKKKESVIKGILKFTTQHKQWTILLSVLGDKTFLLNVQAVRISLLLLPVGRLYYSRVT